MSGEWNEDSNRSAARSVGPTIMWHPLSNDNGIPLEQAGLISLQKPTVESGNLGVVQSGHRLRTVTTQESRGFSRERYQIV